MKRSKIIIFWIVGILFIASGLAKLLHVDPVSIEIFQRAKYPDWMYYAVAVTELTGGVLMLIVKTRRLGALMICGIMFGAIYTHHHLKDELWHFIVPGLLLLLAMWVVSRIKD